MRAMMAVMICSCMPFAECVFEEPVACTEQFVYGVNATVTDLSSGSPIEGATLTLTEGDYVEVMEEIQGGSYVGAGERAGTYSLSVEAEGFQAMTVEDIVVTEDECHVIPVSVDVEMLPL